MTQPRALGVVRDLLQTEDIVLLASAVFTKYAPEQVTPDYQGDFVGWHQDLRYWGLQSTEDRGRLKSNIVVARLCLFVRVLFLSHTYILHQKKYQLSSTCGKHQLNIKSNKYKILTPGSDGEECEDHQHVDGGGSRG